MNRVILAFCFLLCISGLKAQQITAYFVSMPEELLLQIEPNRRKDMIDFFSTRTERRHYECFGRKFRDHGDVG